MKILKLFGILFLITILIEIIAGIVSGLGFEITTDRILINIIVVYLVQKYLNMI